MVGAGISHNHDDEYSHNPTIIPINNGPAIYINNKRRSKGCRHCSRLSMYKAKSGDSLVSIRFTNARQADGRKSNQKSSCVQASNGLLYSEEFDSENRIFEMSFKCWISINIDTLVLFFPQLFSKLHCYHYRAVSYKALEVILATGGYFSITTWYLLLKNGVALL